MGYRKFMLIDSNLTELENQKKELNDLNRGADLQVFLFIENFDSKTNSISEKE